jgi:hypothetical protein
VKQISGINEFEFEFGILADKKDVIWVDRTGNVTRFTPSTGEEVALFKIGDFSKYGATFDPTNNTLIHDESRR